MGERKIFAGPRVRRLRQTLGVTQAAMARDLDISASYLNLVERDQRPLTARLLLQLAETYDLDLRDLSGEFEERLAAEMREILTDPMFASHLPAPQEVVNAAAGTPTVARAFVDLYRAHRRLADDVAFAARSATAADAPPRKEDDRFPIDEVRDYFHRRLNYVEELDLEAEALRDEMGTGDDLMSRLRARLAERHGVRISVVPVHAMPDSQRRFDRHHRRLFLSELLPPSSRLFQTAVHLALIEQAPLLDRLIDEAALETPDSQRLCRIGLANYFAGALMMPYHAFHEAAERTRYDMNLLAGRFDASIEQVAHRLTTLQRRDRKGVPFFLLRLDNAGNISKRFSAGGFHFARYGGACPRWGVHDAFASPGQTIVELVGLPDDTTYLTVSRTVSTMPAPHPESPRRLAISLGCEAVHAPRLVYADGLDLASPSAVTPIGITCRVCERQNCPARASPPMTRPLAIDATRKSLSAFEFG